ncbi:MULTISPECIES: NUDIX domain-containing protein [unclassified Rhizobacter]|uniref:NUDIX hydrolase n=1 Tax=unclassified Rhizobacter TaxID=2640088 RepID=UPI0009EC026E|nr:MULTISPECIES: NUDIX domain-containing protein [unclassified Rhizobacter]
MNPVPNKVCPVILRTIGGDLQILAFEHPLAGCQLVKGTIEPGETIHRAALRELGEESGIHSASVRRDLGIWAQSDGQVWAFVECAPNRVLAEKWVHHAPDDEGHDFRFFWQSFSAPFRTEQWHRIFSEAARFVANAVGSTERNKTGEDEAG